MASVAGDHLIRFDGTRFDAWQQPKDAHLPGKITSLLGARDGTLWIGCRRGLSRLKNGKLSTYTKPTDSFGISTMIEDHSGKIWLTRYRTPNGEGALCEVGERGLRCYGSSDGLAAKYGVGLAEDAAGNLWFAAESLYRWKPGTQATQYFNAIDHPQLLDVAPDHSGNVWVSMGEAGPQFGVRYFHGGAWGEYLKGSLRSSTLTPTALFVDRAGAVWIGTENDGFYRVWNGTVGHFSKSNGLSGHGALGFYEDREGNLWVTTDGGMDLFHNTPVITYSMDEGLSSPGVSTVLASNDGTVWAGEQGNVGDAKVELADILRPGPSQRFTKGPSLPGRIGAMLQDHSGALWFGLERDQLVVYEHGRVESVLPRDGHILRESILTIVEDTSQTISALTPTQLVRIRDRRVIEEIDLPVRLSQSGYLAANPMGGLWIVGQGGSTGPGEGVTLYQNGIMRGYPLPASTTPISVSHIVADSADPLLLATSVGLLRWNGKSWDVLNETAGLPCNALLGAIKDERGSLWLPADCGLVKLEALELQKWRQNPEHRPSFTNFDALDGARPRGTGSTFEPTASLGPDGRVWFASGGVIQMVDPDHIYKNLLPPAVHVDQLIADDRPFLSEGRTRLPSNPHNLEIEYTALSFSVPQKVLFRYFLEGHDKGWQGPVRRRQAFYTDLAPGTYRFHVVACNNSGVWNEEGAFLDFSIAPAYYQTNWFRALCVGAFLGLLWVLYQFRIRQLHQKFAMVVEARVNERTRIARDLHDTVLQSLHGLLMSFQRAANLLPDRPVEAKQRLEGAIDQAAQAITEGREAVQGLRSSTVVTNDLAVAIRTLGEELAAQQTGEDAPLFFVAVEGTVRDLNPILRDDVYRISGEALRNAFHHANARRIEVELQYDKGHLRVRVRDDGQGVDSGVFTEGRSGHWGVEGMRERAKLLGGQLEVWSELGSGTEIQLSVPASIAYLSSDLGR